MAIQRAAEPLVPYYIYAKSPNSKRFNRCTSGLYFDYEFAVMEINRFIENCKTPGTIYQIRQGRAVKLSITKQEEEHE